MRLWRGSAGGVVVWGGAGMIGGMQGGAGMTRGMTGKMKGTMKGKMKREGVGSGDGVWESGFSHFSQTVMI